MSCTKSAATSFAGKPKFELPPVVHCAERLLAEVTVAVQTFSRGHRFSYGVDLRDRAMHLASVATRAWRDIPRQLQHIDDLVREMDDFRIYLRLGKQIHAFASFAQFEQLARTAEELGRQIGGWRKQQHLKGQNPASTESPATGASHDTEYSGRPAVQQLSLLSGANP